MKKKTYKKLINRINNETRKRIEAEAKIGAAVYKAEAAEEKAQRYEKRFREIGSNIKTLNPGSGKALVMMKWEIKPEKYGTYAKIDNRRIKETNTEEIYNEIRKKLANNIAEGLLDQNIVQIIFKGQNEYDPISEYSTVGMKLYVVPWEMMAEYGQKIELRKYVENPN